MLVWGTQCQVLHAAALRAGVAQVSITKDKPTATVNDLVYAKALVVDDGTTKVAIVCLDVGGLPSALVSGVRTRVQEGLGIAESHVLLAASHNHHTQGQTGPERGGASFRGGPDRPTRPWCRSSTVPVSATSRRITMNRRLRLKNGKAWTIRRANPSPKDADVVGLGPLDPQIGILRLDRLDGRPLAVLYNFAGHAYGGVPSGGVTADFPRFCLRPVAGSARRGGSWSLVRSRRCR